MKSLLKKYRDNSLSPRELEILRERISTISDEELAEAMMLANDEYSEDCKITEETIARMKFNIDMAISMQEMTPDQQNHSPWKHRVMIAATLLLPIFMITTAVLFFMGRGQDNPYDDSPTIIATGPGEKSTVTLPDGTVVMLNSLSRLEFNTNSSASTRQVSFNGEAYFSVAKVPGSVFEINTQAVNIEVLGTEFSLMARQSSDYTELMLDSGHVNMICNSTHNSVNLHQGQMVTFNKTDKEFTVEEFPAGTNTCWRFSGVRFDDVAPDSLINSLEEIYNIHLNDYIVSAVDVNFTGTLPNDDLFATLEILSRVYDFPTPFTIRRRQ